MSGFSGLTSKKLHDVHVSNPFKKGTASLEKLGTSLEKLGGTKSGAGAESLSAASGRSSASNEDKNERAKTHESHSAARDIINAGGAAVTKMTDSVKKATKSVTEPKKRTSAKDKTNDAKIGPSSDEARPGKSGLDSGSNTKESSSTSYVGLSGAKKSSSSSFTSSEPAQGKDNEEHVKTTKKEEKAKKGSLESRTNLTNLVTAPIKKVTNPITNELKKVSHTKETSHASEASINASSSVNDKKVKPSSASKERDSAVETTKAYQEQKAEGEQLKAEESQTSRTKLQTGPIEKLTKPIMNEIKKLSLTEEKSHVEASAVDAPYSDINVDKTKSSTALKEEDRAVETTKEGQKQKKKADESKTEESQTSRTNVETSPIMKLTNPIMNEVKKFSRTEEKTHDEVSANATSSGTTVDKTKSPTALQEGDPAAESTKEGQEQNKEADETTTSVTKLVTAPMKKLTNPITKEMKKLSHSEDKLHAENSVDTSSSATDGEKEKRTSPLKQIEGVIIAPFKNITEHFEKSGNTESNIGSKASVPDKSPSPKDPDEPDLKTRATIDKTTDLEGNEEEEKDIPVEKTIDKFLTSYWPKKKKKLSDLILFEDGFMYLTESEMKFVGALGTKLVWEWKDLSAEKAKSKGGMVDNAIRIKYDSDEEESRTFFFTFLHRDDAYKQIDRLIDLAKEDTQEGSGERGLPAVPPDNTLKKMNVIIKKRLRGVSVRDFYEVCWSEGNRTDKEPFYGPWLKSSGKEEVIVGDWEYADDGADFVGGWCGEKYSQRRIVTCKFTSMGQLADVKHTQYCRVEGNDKFVLAMTVETQGVPFGDCFEVEIRWVASRIGAKDLSVQVGLFVNFKKSTMLEGKIRSGSTTQTTKAQMDLFEHVKKACSTLTGAVTDEEVEEEEESEKEADKGPSGRNVCFFFSDFFSQIFGGRRRTALLDSSEQTVSYDDFVQEINGARNRLEKVLVMVNESGSQSIGLAQNVDILESEIRGASESLKAVLDRLEQPSNIK